MGWPDHVHRVPTMERLRSREDGGGLLAELPETVPDGEARRQALVFAGQMRRVRAALPRLVEEEYDRRRSSGTIGSDEVLDVLLQALAGLQDLWGTEETRGADCPTVVRMVSAADAPEHVGSLGERPSRRGSETWTRAEGPDGEVQFRVTVPVRERLGSIGEENEWLGPDVAAVTSAQREGSGAGPVPWRGIGVAELCEGRIRLGSGARRGSTRWVAEI